MIYPVVRELAGDGVAVATACRVLQVSTSGSTAGASAPPAPATSRISSWSRSSRRSTRTPAAPTVSRGCTPSCAWAQGLAVSRNRVERLMRVHGIVGVHRRPRGGATRRIRPRRPAPTLAERRSRAEAPDQLWRCDIT